MNDDAFARLVAEDVKNKISMSQRAALRTPENYQRWQRALLALLSNIDGQIEDIAADRDADKERYTELGRDGSRLLAEAMRDYENRLKKIERFRFHASKRLDEVTALIEKGDSSVALDAELLISAIRKHKSMFYNFGLEATPIDKALWSVLENQWLFDSISEADMLDYCEA
jgi:hypothetical protein